MKKLFLLTLLFLSFSLSLFAQEPVQQNNDDKPANEKKTAAPPIKLISGISMYASISSLLTDVSSSSLREQLGTAEFEKLKVYGNAINYPDCLNNKIDDAIMFTGAYRGSAALFNKFSMYKVASFFSTIKHKDLAVIKIPATENKTIDDCALNTDLYFIIELADIKEVN